MATNGERDGTVEAGGPLAVALRYFEAWNRRDPDEIVRAFAEGGTYSDPTSGGELTGAAIGAYAGGLFAAFPNLSFEIVSASAIDDGRVVGEWVMRGTNTGSFDGLPPTGHEVVLPGVDVIAVAGDRIRSVRGYFDGGTLVRQLGLQVVVQSRALGPVEFGTSVRMNVGGGKQPGAFSVTMLEVRDERDETEVRERSRGILREMAQLPGLISVVLGTVGTMMFTVSAWEQPDQPRQLLREGGAHREATRRFFGPDFTRGGATTVWEPHRINTMWVRCGACGRMADAHRSDGACECGTALPEHPPYW
jgi:steroid delta-isomerase-like uncharacterized protein